MDKCCDVKKVGVWLLMFVLLVICEFSGTVKGQNLQSNQPTSIYQSYFMVGRQIYCSNPIMRGVMYKCFENANPCSIPQDIYDYYIKHPEEQKKFDKHLEIMCTDKDYQKAFVNFAACMDNHIDAWTSCRATETKLVQEMATKIQNNEPSDNYCESSWTNLINCYKSAGDKYCANSTDVVIGTYQMGTPEGMCSSCSILTASSLSFFLAAIMAVLIKAF